VRAQTYTYDIKPIKDSSRPEQKLVMMGSTASSEGGPMGGTHSAGTADNSDNIHSYEVSRMAIDTLLTTEPGVLSALAPEDLWEAPRT
jgi:hypothetical protein